MSQSRDLDAVVVGSGPNGLAAAITLARAGRSVIVFEAAPTLGGGCRSSELTLPGFVHDVCSAIHPLAAASPFFRELPLAEHGLELIHPDVPMAHPLDDGSAAVLKRSVDETADGLGADGPSYRRMMGWMVEDADKLLHDILGPLRVPSHPVSMVRFGMKAMRSAVGLAHSSFRGVTARALLGGLAAHSMLSLTKMPAAAFGLLLGLLGHSAGWPMVRGGSQKLVDAMAAYLKSLGGEIITSRPITKMQDLPSARSVLFDVSPRNLVDIAGDQLPDTYVRKLSKFRYGPGVFKMDWALDGPIPWRAQECSAAGTVHLGGALPALAEAELAVSQGRHAERPFVLMAQQSLFDSERAPAGKHTAWGYCHVPNGSTTDMSEQIENQVERFAPGFRERIVAKATMDSRRLNDYNPNYIGGDINGGLADLRQLFMRPTAAWSPHSTPNKSIFLCSASSPPGGGVHGMCGYLAAKAALRTALK